MRNGAEQDTRQVPTVDHTQGSKGGGSRGPTKGTRQVPSQQKEKEKEKKERIPKGIPKKEKFAAPSVGEVRAYAEDYAAGKGWGGFGDFDPERFCDFYASKGWKVGTSAMRDWRAAVRGWIARDRREGGAGDDQRFAAYA